MTALQLAYSQYGRPVSAWEVNYVGLDNLENIVPVTPSGRRNPLGLFDYSGRTWKRLRYLARRGRVTELEEGGRHYYVPGGVLSPEEEDRALFLVKLNQKYPWIKEE